MSITTVEKVNRGPLHVSSIKQETYFVPVVDGREYSHIAETEDIALLIGLGIKYDGVNSQFTRFATRMLGLESEWSK